jgi:hypothetical protein
MLPVRLQFHPLQYFKVTYHARWEENPRFHIVQQNVARHLANRVSDSKDGIDLVELIPLEAQLFSHPRNIRIVQVRAVQVVDEVHEAAKGKDEEVELLHQLSFAWRMLLAPKVLDKAVAHDAKF